MIANRSRQAGFTLIELLIATTVFATVLLLSLAAVVQIGRMYYKGVTTSQTQQVARSILDEVSQSIQLGSIGITAANGSLDPSDATRVSAGFLCVGDLRYSYVINKQQSNPKDAAFGGSQSLHVLWADGVGNCASKAGASSVTLDRADPNGTGNPIASGGHELLGAKMRLTRFVVAPLAGSTSLYKVQVSVVYGDDDLLTPPDATGRRACKGVYTGTQFCAISELSTLVQKRI